ncbi:MAG TPA: amidohydrolase family protein [Candidatus Dormibacteraeota bacterium]|nr:amidohydrolase family protein [Candidatus Dormibacteraeota bacterium]
MSRRLRITGGLVVTPAGVQQTNIVVSGGRVVGLGAQDGQDADDIDAEGCYVLPGGVDPHTHLLADVASATRSAAFGGTTTAVCFSNPRPRESAPQAVIRGRRQVEKTAAIDVALHAIVGEPDRVTTADLERLRGLGVRGVKLFLAFPEQGLMASDGCLYEVMRAAARLGLLVRVHCENGSVIEALISEYLAQGKRQASYFARSRPPEVEEEAIARTLAIAGLAGAAVYITHVTTAGGIQAIRAARAQGQVAHAEVCLHHLLLDASRHQGKSAERFLVAPPLRLRKQLEALWSAVADGTVDTIGSDHAQSQYQPRPKKPGDFTGLLYGLAGIELRLPLLLSEGLRRGLPIQRLAQLAATGPAQLFGLFPRKGAISPGADADLVVWDPRPEWKVRASALHDGVGHSPYSGMTVRGAIRTVLLRGTVLVANGAWVGLPSPGRYLSA